MKTRIMAMVSAMMLTLGVAAQDTLQIHGPRSYQYCSYWPQFDTVAYYALWEPHTDADVMAYRMETASPLTVYGLAVCMSTEPLLEPDNVASLGNIYWSDFWDTTYKDVYKYVGLFEADPDSLRAVGDKLKVHINTTPVSYYMDLGLVHPYTFDTFPILPMYERYFTEPVTVDDTFYVGIFGSAVNRISGRYPHLHILFPHLSTGVPAHLSVVFHMDTSWTRMFRPEKCEWQYLPDGGVCGYDYPFLFPILTPDSNSHDDTQDTIVPGGDTIVPGIDTTTAVRQADMLRRYTGVQPNPATGKVQVVSSFGMTRVEVYDAAGKRRYEGEATGLVHTVNVEGWPAGTYLVRIHTPLGTATKKLIVRSE